MSVLKRENNKLVAVVMAGGVGSRLWPISRESHPKPFMIMPDGESLIRKTYSRAKSIASHFLTVTNKDYYFISLSEQALSRVSGDFILEPFPRNTGAAIAIAAEHVRIVHGPDTLMLILPSDHLVKNNYEFELSVKKAIELATDGYLVTFGLPPLEPDTGFGYIEKGAVLGKGFEVKSFVEKPSVELANEFISSNNFFWNSGMYCFSAAALLDELSRTAPQLKKSLSNIYKSMQGSNNLHLTEIDPILFENVPEVSLDTAVFEKATKCAVVLSDFGWSDIGSWSAVRDMFSTDEDMNRVQGEAIFIDTRNTFVLSDSRLVATVGVDDLLIIDTKDALLVARSDKAQDVKRVVAKLKHDRHNTSKEHSTVFRPWGTYTVLEESSGFKIKKIVVNPGASLSLQLHNHRSEHWVVVSGVAQITNGTDKNLIYCNQSTYIPAGQKHRLTNPGSECCVMIEVQCGDYLDESDIVRFEDVYGR